MVSMDSPLHHFDHMSKILPRLSLMKPIHIHPVSPLFDPRNRKLSGEALTFVPNGVNYSPPMMNGDEGAIDIQS